MSGGGNSNNTNSNINPLAGGVSTSIMMGGGASGALGASNGAMANLEGTTKVDETIL